MIKIRLHLWDFGKRKAKPKSFCYATNERYNKTLRNIQDVWRQIGHADEGHSRVQEHYSAWALTNSNYPNRQITRAVWSFSDRTSHKVAGYYHTRAIHLSTTSPTCWSSNSDEGFSKSSLRAIGTANGGTQSTGQWHDSIKMRNSLQWDESDRRSPLCFNKLTWVLIFNHPWPHYFHACVHLLVQANVYLPVHSSVHSLLYHSLHSSVLPSSFIWIDV